MKRRPHSKPTRDFSPADNPFNRFPYSFIDVIKSGIQRKQQKETKETGERGEKYYSESFSFRRKEWGQKNSNVMGRDIERGIPRQVNYYLKKKNSEETNQHNTS